MKQKVGEIIHICCITFFPDFSNCCEAHWKTETESETKHWKNETNVMAILNITDDSFSDGGFVIDFESSLPNYLSLILITF